MKIALFGSSKPDAVAQIKQILTSLDGVEVAMLDESEPEPTPQSKNSCTVLSDCDMVLSVGGDGTFLRAAAKVGDSGVPILGVNAGHLGFLADVQLSEINELLPDMISGQCYDIETRSLLKLDIPQCVQPYQRYALNEVAILKRDVSSMVSVSVWVDGVLLNQYDADGLAIATPTGSTAYAMSAGGPILEPQSDCFLLVPIAPHSLTTRPLVIRDSCTLEVKVASRNSLFLVAVDGLPLHLTTQYQLRLCKAEHRVAVVRQKSHSFYDTLRTKLMWGVDKRYQ